MKRRGFLGAVAGLVAAPLMPSTAPVAKPAPTGLPRIPVVPANGRGFILGVAMETVKVGDFVQIQTTPPT